MESGEFGTDIALDVSGFLRGMIDSLYEAGLFVDKTRTIRHCNRAAEKIFGYSREELLGMRTEVLYGDRRQDKMNNSEIKNRLSSYGYHFGNAQGVTKDGKIIPLELYTFIIKEDTGAAILIREARLSIQAPGKAEPEDPARLLQNLMDSIPDMIYFKDLNNKFIAVNKAHAAALNLTPRDIIGKSDLDFFPKELAEAYFSDDNEILRTGKPVLDKIEKAPRPDGGITYVSTTKTPRFDRDGRVIGTIGITRNVTERVAAEEELRVYKNYLEELVKERTKELEGEQEKLLRMYGIKSEFVSLVSHELRTPLAVIKESVSVVSDGTAGRLNEKQKRFLEITLAHIDRLSRLINDVLDFSKLENHKMEHKIIEGDLNEIIDQVAKSYELVMKKKDLKLYKNLDPSLPLARFDPDRITQVLYNLFTNAIKFTEKGSVSVRSEKYGSSRVRVVVEDTGPGIEAKDLHRIFEKFEQVSRSDGTRHSGTGLGLAISKQIIEQLGGEIWADSEYGKGSRFIFTLPIK